ncbi:MAG: PDZ domain-containing protein, partial [Bacteroidales bacterium]|nr:PDZ domain-containing protein [Bacteroidales bacterium]
GKSSSWQFRAKKSTIASFDMNDLIMEYSTDSGGALSGKSGHIGLIGNKVWERFYVIIDLRNKRLYLKPNSSFNKESNFNTLGFTFTDRSKMLGCWVVNGLFQGSNAEKAGLKGGDRILEVNGKDVKSISEVKQEALYEKSGEVKLKVESPQRKSVNHLIIK